MSGVEACDEHGTTIARVFLHGNVKPSWFVAKRMGTMLGPDAYVPIETVASIERELGERPPDTQPDIEHEPELVSLLALADSGEVSEQDRRRIHALADYVTAHTSLCQVVADAMTASECWTEPGVIAKHVDRARNLLTAMQANADFLTSTNAGDVDLSLVPNVARA